MARPRVGPPALGRAALPGGEPPHSPAFASGAGRAMGMAVGPGAPNPTPTNTPWQVVPEVESPPDTPDRPESQRLGGTARRWTSRRLDLQDRFNGSSIAKA
jgi:hypothetical protein